MNVLKTALTNVWRLRDRYLPFAAICLAGAFLIVSAITLLGSTRTLTDMLTLPYMGFYKLVPTDTEDTDPTDPVDMAVMSGMTEEFLLAHEAVEEIRLSKTYQKQLPLAHITPNWMVSAKKSWRFPVFLMPDTAYDASFLRGERELRAGRHLTYADRNEYLMLLDEQLAVSNGLTVGSTLTVPTDGGEVVYRIAGLFRTHLEQPLADYYADMYVNAVIVSAVPDESGWKSSRDLYVKFAPGVDGDAFAAYMDEHGSIGPTQNNRRLAAVEELNADYNKGANTLFTVTAVMLAALILIVLAADFAFCRVLISSRRREILILRALHAGRGRIAGQFLLELSFVLIPFSVLGTVLAARFSRAAIGEILMRFSSMISPENLRSTSSRYIDNVHTIKAAVTDPLSPEQLMTLCIAACAIFGVMLLIGSAFQLWRAGNEKLMHLLSEGRQ